MDEEEKPFPIEYFVIFLLIALANDIAQVFFILLDFTGVGIAGEAIMEPINAVLDFFFIGVFYWRTKSFGGSTTTQYIGGGAQLILIPGRIASVWGGMWLANNQDSVLGKIATTAASLESGNAAGAASKAEGVAETAGSKAASAEKELQSDASGKPKTAESAEATGEGSPANNPEESKPSEGEKGGEGKEEPPENDVFKNPLDNPVETAGEEAFNPSEDNIQEGKLAAADDKNLPNAK
jgi:hypothetical protein